MIESISFDDFMQNPKGYICEAMKGNFCKVKSENGYAAVLINETEWTMLSQALKLCMEHPEWTINQ